MAHGEEEDFSPEFLPPRPVCGEKTDVRGKWGLLVGQEFPSVDPVAAVVDSRWNRQAAQKQFNSATKSQ
jgi:hypothetical protein